MSRVVKRFHNHSALEFDEGSFNKWCVYFINPEGKRKAPLDQEYFLQLQDLSTRYGAQKVYNDFVKIYKLTGKDIDENVLDIISELSNEYEDSLYADVLFTNLYMAMIAEENWDGTRLGKRIKRLGVHELLLKNMSAENAANFMRGMDWRQIDTLCKENGF